MKQANRSEKCHIADRQTRKNHSRSRMYHVGDMIVGGEVGSIARTKLGQQISLTSFGILQKMSRSKGTTDRKYCRSSSKNWPSIRRTSPLSKPNKKEAKNRQSLHPTFQRTGMRMTEISCTVE